MKTKGIILTAALFWAGLLGARAEAFTLLEIGCKLCDPSVIAGISDPALKASLAECCKCHAPCMSTPGGGAVIDPVFEACVKNKETCTPPPCDHPPLVDECKTDADCAGKDTDNNPCTSPVCNRMMVDGICPDGTKWGGMVAKCGGPETPIPGCTPKTCADKYPGDGGAIRCCEKGFDTDPATFKCCRKHIALGEPYADKITGKPIPCNGDDNCPKCPDCRPPTVDCNVIADPAMKACCVAKGGFLWFMMDSCVHNSSDCNIIANIGGDVNGQLNICCNVLNNTGTISGSTIEQSCSNTGGGPGGTGPGSGTGTPTTPAALGTCEVKCKDVDCNIAVDKAGQGVGWVVTYSPPPDAGPVASAALKQLEGPGLIPEEPSGGAGGALSIKTITDPSSLPPFVVYTPRPTSMMGEYLPHFKVAVELRDLADAPVATLQCEQKTDLEAKGGGSGCGCSMTARRTPLEELVADAMILLLLGSPALLLRRMRKRVKS